MKSFLRTLFSPILNHFERGEGEYHYQPLNRKILIFIGLVFSGLASLVLLFVPEGVGLSFMIPVIIFGLVALVALVIGFLGNERAVSKIWGDR